MMMVLSSVVRGDALFSGFTGLRHQRALLLLLRIVEVLFIVALLLRSVLMSASGLIDAFKGGNKLLAQRLLDSNPSNVRSEWTKFPSLLYNKQLVGQVSLLHLAAYWGWKDFTERLVTSYSDAIKDSEGHLPLHYAAYNGHLDLVRYFITEHSCSPIAENNYNSTPLHLACSNGQLNVVQYLISEAHCNPSCEDNYGDTPLHYASGHGHLEIAQYLISEAHCNPSCVDNNGDTPLHDACSCGYLNIVQYLVGEAHCDPLCLCSHGSTPLHNACGNGHLNVVQYLIREAHCNPSCVSIGSTPLHNACGNGHLNVVHYLISEAHCNASCKDYSGRTPLHIATMRDHAHIVQYLLPTSGVNPLAKDKFGHTPLYYAMGRYNIVKLFQPFIDCSRDFPVHTFTKLILTGDGGAGKTTLAQLIIQASQTCFTTPESHNLFGRVIKMLQGGDRVAEVQHFTAGIVPHHVKSEQLGNFVMYDFAGQQEYFSSHAAVLEQVMRRSAAMFVCMIDLSKSSEEICESLHYWLSFIENACSATDVKSHVAIVGSHADKAWFSKKKSTLLQEIAASRVKHTCQEYAGYTAMDCRRTNTSDSDRFISVLTDTHKAIAASQPAISYHCHLLYAFLHTKLDAIGCTLHDLILAISKEEDSSLPNDPSVLSKLLTILSDKGLILFIQHPQSSWIVVKTEALLKEINGTLFAPRHFKEYRDLASNTGIIPASILHKAFPKHNLEMLIGFLESLDFCRWIDPLLLQYTNLQTTPSHSTDDLFFFPGLVQSQRPDSLTKHGTLQFGWCLGCADPNQFFGSRFLHLLLLSITYRFPLDIQIRASPSLHGLQRKCTIWKNGILWVDDNNITTVVEVIDRNRWVLVAMSCSEDRPVEHAKLRSALISLVHRLQQERCSSLEVHEFIVSPNLVQQYPFDSLIDNNLFAIKHLANSILLHKPRISNQSDKFTNHLLTQSLPLEPYKLISPSDVCDLFDAKMADQPVPAPLLQKVQEKICQFGRSPQVCRQLREYLDSMSIFAGRNPLVSGTQHCIGLCCVQ